MKMVPPYGQIELEHEIEHAEQQRRIVDADHAAEAADRHHDQESTPGI